ncbi:MAG: hypothetical protein LBK94_02250 [Prevotellaceae bacterium]|jgi:hypothetical protein|nr:hypothetical protein [Prevotellaceae bacterium]
MKTNDANMELLLEKYFEGFTALKEERQLRKYFRHKKLPKHLETYRPVFMFLESEIKRKHRVKHFILHCKNQGIAAIAACLILLFGLTVFLDADRVLEKSTAYINGKEITDRELIRVEILASLNNISDGNTDIYATQLDALNSFFDND